MKHPELGSARAFYRHQSLTRFFEAIVKFVVSIKPKNVDYFVDGLLKFVERTHLETTWAQDMLLELVIQRVCQISMDNTSIPFDSSMGETHEAHCRICKGKVWNDSNVCWFHHLQEIGLEAKYSSDEAEFGLFALRDLPASTTFPYLGKKTKKHSRYSLAVTNNIIIDASDLHSCPTRYLNHSSARDANCRWINGNGCKSVLVKLIQDVPKGCELTIPYSKNHRSDFNGIDCE